MPEQAITGPGGRASIPFVARECACASRGLRAAAVVSDGLRARPWSGNIRDVVAGLSPIWLTRNGALRPSGVAGLAALHEVPCPPGLPARGALACPRMAGNPRALATGTLTSQLRTQPAGEGQCG